MAKELSFLLNGCSLSLKLFFSEINLLFLLSLVSLSKIFHTKFISSSLLLRFMSRQFKKFELNLLSSYLCVFISSVTFGEQGWAQKVFGGVYNSYSDKVVFDVLTDGFMVERSFLGVALKVVNFSHYTGIARTLAKHISFPVKVPFERVAAYFNLSGVFCLSDKVLNVGRRGIKSIFEYFLVFNLINSFIKATSFWRSLTRVTSMLTFLEYIPKELIVSFYSKALRGFQKHKEVVVCFKEDMLSFSQNNIYGSFLNYFYTHKLSYMSPTIALLGY